MKYGIDCIGVSVSACIFDENRENILLARRSKENPRFPDVWEFVGGSLELGETMNAGLAREVMEEVGVEFAVDAWLPPAEYVKSNMHFVNLFAVGYITSGTPKVCEPEKCAELKWVHTDEVLSGTFPLADYCSDDVISIKKYLNK